MPFTDPIINALKENGGIKHVLDNITHSAQVPGFGSFEFLLHGLTQEAGSGAPDVPIIDAHSDQVINAEADMHAAPGSLDLPHDASDAHHGTDLYAADAGAVHAETAYAGHDDASATGA